MKTHFPAGFFRANRERLRQHIEGDDWVVMLTANGLIQRRGDTTFPFAQESNFWYLTGVDEADLTLIITPRGEYLVTREQGSIRDTFDGAIDHGELKSRSGIMQIFTGSEGIERIVADQRSAGRLLTLRTPPPYLPEHGLYPNPARRHVTTTYKRRFNHKITEDIRPLLIRLRSRKQPEEIAAIEAAVHITHDTLQDIRADIHSYAHEYEIEADITRGFRRRGAKGHAYTPIVASGEHATTLHYVKNSSPIRKGELIVIDVGAEVEEYAADITRTLSTSKPSRRQMEVWCEVRSIQMRASEELKPGITMALLEKSVVKWMGVSLVRLGLITSEYDIDGIRHYFPHSTSHFLGLDVHDVGDYAAPLEEHMVVTCEPGIYIPEEGIGIRLEDDVLITRTGSHILGGDCDYGLYAV